MSDAAELKGKRGLRRLINALGYSRDGIAAAWRNEAAFRQELMLSLPLLACRKSCSPPSPFRWPSTSAKPALNGP